MRDSSSLRLAEPRIGKGSQGELIPQSSELGKKLLEAPSVELPKRLPWKRETGESKPAKHGKGKHKRKAATRVKLQTRRK